MVLDAALALVLYALSAAGLLRRLPPRTLPESPGAGQNPDAR